MKSKTKKIVMAIAVTVFMGFIGLIVGALFNGLISTELFDLNSVEWRPVISIIFSVATMGGFILNTIEEGKKR